MKDDFDRDCLDAQPEEESSDEEKEGEDDEPRRRDSDEDEEEKQVQQDDQPAVAQKAPDHLTQEKMFLSLFELADTWCPDIDPIQYKQFFEQLTKKIKLPGQDNPAAYDAVMD